MADVGVGGGIGYGDEKPLRSKPSVCSPRLMLRWRVPVTVAPVVTSAVLLRETAGRGTGDGTAGALTAVSITAMLACRAIDGRRVPGKPRRGDSEPERSMAGGKEGGSSGIWNLRFWMRGEDEVDDEIESIESDGLCRGLDVEVTGDDAAPPGLSLDGSGTLKDDAVGIVMVGRPLEVRTSR